MKISHLNSNDYLIPYTEDTVKKNLRYNNGDVCTAVVLGQLNGSNCDRKSQLSGILTGQLNPRDFRPSSSDSLPLV